MSEDAKFIDVTVCRNVLQGQLYLLLLTNGNDFHMYLLGSLTMLQNRFHQSEDYSVWFSVIICFAQMHCKMDRSFWKKYLKTQ